MNPNDAAKLLAVAAAFDNRKPDATSAQAWAMALGGYRFEDCQQAIVKHYQDSTEWIMPSHVITAVKKLRTGRLEDVAPTPPPDMDPDDTAAYQRWLTYVRRAIADGREPEEHTYEATRSIGELRHVLRAVPAIEAKPRGKSAEHQDALENARAELGPLRAAIQAKHPTPPMQEPTEGEPA